MTEIQKRNIKRILLAVLLVLVTAAFAFVAYLMEYGPVKIVRYYVLMYTVCYLACVDIKKQIVPNRILLGLLLVRALLLIPELLLYPAYIGGFLLASVLGAVLGMAVLFVGNIICKKGMGLGDIKLFGVIGCYVGPEAVLFVLFFSLFLAAIYSIILLLGKKIGAKDEIPFVPFVFAGLIVTCLLGI